MNHHPHLPPREWARRVNRSWIVRDGLADHAEAWLDHLAGLQDGRAEIVSKAALRMCDLRSPLDDPKPWFYAGLFSLATPEEARRFLGGHRVTKATVPSMRDDEDVRLWVARVSAETLAMLDHLRDGVRATLATLTE